MHLTDCDRILSGILTSFLILTKCTSNSSSPPPLYALTPALPPLQRHLALYRNTEVNVTKIGSSNNAQLAIEATTLLKFSAHHPQHLLRMLGVVCSHPEGSSDGGRLLVSEHAPLGSLKSFFQYLDVDDFTVPFDHKAEILKQVGRGFACLAAEKIRVKNLSSESVMVFAFDLEDVAATRVKIADYGLNCVGSVDSKRYATRNCSNEGFDSLISVLPRSLFLSLPQLNSLDFPLPRSPLARLSI